MSVEAVWDLKSRASASELSYSPKSACVFAAPYEDTTNSSSNNPFETTTTASNVRPPTPRAIVIGSEEGSLHYKSYPTLLEDDAPKASFGSPGRNRTPKHQPLPALGVTPSGRPPSNLPKSYLPVDLPAKSLPGPVVDVIPALPLNTKQQQQSLVGLFLVLVDDNKGSSQQGGSHVAAVVALQNGAFTKVANAKAKLPERVSCATYHERCGFVVCSGKRICSLPIEPYLESLEGSALSRMVGKHKSGRSSSHHTKYIDFSSTLLPPPGARGGPNSLIVTAHGRLAVLAVGNSFYAVPGVADATTTATPPAACKIFSFGQSSQIHPLLVVDVHDRSVTENWSSLLLCNGREAALVDVHLDDLHHTASTAGARSKASTASPILAAAASWPFCLLLTSDGLVSVRAGSCLAVALKTVEVGTRPNDFFALRSFLDSTNNSSSTGRHSFYPEPNTSETNTTSLPLVVSLSYSGQAKLLKCAPDTRQDLADRLMRVSIDAFGANQFPRSQLAEALQCSFTSTSYAGPEPTPASKSLLKEYLESLLGLTESESGAVAGWPTVDSNNNHKPQNIGSPFGTTSPPTVKGYNPGDDKNSTFSVVDASDPNALLTATALLCLVCAQLPKGSIANRAARKCAIQMGVIVLDEDGTDTKHGISKAAIQVNELVADRLMKEAVSNRPLLSGSSSSINHMEFVEAAAWLLRSCGRHERAIEVLREQHKAPESAKRGFWSPIKYQSYTASHLSELWGIQIESSCRLVLRSPATVRLLETNAQLGLSVFTSNHPQNASQWRKMADHDDPLSHPKHPSQVVRLLKNIQPLVAYNRNAAKADDDDDESDDDMVLPLESGRALAVAFLESAIGISTHRPEADEFDLLDKSMEYYPEDLIADFHDELCFLLLEGVIFERNGQQENPQQSDGSFDDGDATQLGEIYRHKLRRFLKWPLAKIRSERLLEALPRSFLQEKALVLGRLNRHGEALKILYCNCKSMDLALEYCDMLHSRRKTQLEKERARLAADSMLDDRANDELDEKFQKENAYLPLVQVALETDPDKQNGIASAIQILAMRRGDIDRSAALRLLPDNLPVSAVARPFLIPALVDSESQARRLKVVSSLLRAKHKALKQKLTDAQLKAQANLYVVPQFRAMNLGDPLHSTKPFKARPSASASPTFPDVLIVKHFFPRHLIIQAKITNNSLAVDGRALGNLAFVVAESSEDAIQPASNAAQVPIQVLPYATTGCAWCVLVAAPNRMDGAAMLTCELRYTVLGVDASSGTPLSFAGAPNVSGRTYVEELQDIEVFASHFS